MKRIIAAVAFAAGLSLSPAIAGDTMAPEGAGVYFITPQDGETVKSPVKVVFGLMGMGVAPAGTEKDKTGHHHLFVDRAPFGEGSEGAEEANETIPSDEHHRHFGGGQTEVMLDLPAGQHTLQLVVGDKDHIPHDKPVVSPQITITVE